MEGERWTPPIDPYPVYRPAFIAFARRMRGLDARAYRRPSEVASFGEPQGDGDPGYEMLMEPRVDEPVPYPTSPKRVTIIDGAYGCDWNDASREYIKGLFR